ncbi:MOSC domain-containing protein [Crocinitomix sp.]|nr:MOSC domain-containing protein [Crocinitomix sp.]
MKVRSVNIGEKRLVKWRGKEVPTGIFKYPIDKAIHLGKTDVVGDAVVDRRYHGGTDKACYIYSADHYEFWQTQYPDLEFQDGIFGENITVEGLNEAQIQIGDIFYIGECRVQVRQPRQPCFKLGVRFGTQKIVKNFINNPFPGVYVSVIDEGTVKKGDQMRLSERLHDSIGLLEVWGLLYGTEPDQDLLEFAVNFQHLAEECKASLRKRIK